MSTKSPAPSSMPWIFPKHLFLHSPTAIGPFGVDISALENALQSDSSPRLIFPDAKEEQKKYLAQLKKELPPAKLRRTDDFTRLALAGACQCMNAHGIAKDKGADHLDTGLIVATGLGSAGATFSFLDSVIDHGDACASPTLFSSSVHNSAAAGISMLLGLRGPGLTVSNFELSLHSALFTAWEWLAQNRVKTVILGCLDSGGPVCTDCMSQLHKNSPEPAPATWGASFFVLNRQPKGSAAQITAFGMGATSFDPKNIKSPVILDCTELEYTPCQPNTVQYPFETVSYSPYFGLHPSTSGLNLAAASICLKEKNLFPQNLANPKNTVPDALTCLKISRGRGWGAISVSAPPAD